MFGSSHGESKQDSTVSSEIPGDPRAAVSPGTTKQMEKHRSISDAPRVGEWTLKEQRQWTQDESQQGRMSLPCSISSHDVKKRDPRFPRPATGQMEDMTE